MIFSPPLWEYSLNKGDLNQDILSRILILKYFSSPQRWTVRILHCLLDLNRINYQSLIIHYLLKDINIHWGEHLRITNCGPPSIGGH